MARPSRAGVSPTNYARIFQTSACTFLLIQTPVARRHRLRERSLDQRHGHGRAINAVLKRRVLVRNAGIVRRDAESFSMQVEHIAEFGLGPRLDFNRNAQVALGATVGLKIDSP